MIKYVSWDLQGTLSEAAFSDNFWLELLPAAYAAKHACDLATAKAQLWEQFKAMGKYDIRYYDDAYWASQLGFNTLDVLRRVNVQPRLDSALLSYITSLTTPSIILSTTTNLFIDYELGDKKAFFARTYSCVDDFQTGGKTEEVYREIARQLGIKPQEILHIGDNEEMDITNATRAGVHALHYTGDTLALITALQDILATEGTEV